MLANFSIPEGCIEIEEERIKSLSCVPDHVLSGLNVKQDATERTLRRLGCGTD